MRVSFYTLLCLCALPGLAHAAVITVVPASTVTTAPFRLGNFGSAGTNGMVSSAPVLLSNGTITFGTGSGVYDGDVPSLATSPSPGVNYLAAEPGGAVTFGFSAPQSTFQLLWGSIDSYNSLTFSGGASTVTVTGANIQAIGGTGGAAYVTIAGLGAFTKVVANSSSPAFEFLPSVQVPEPGTLALVGAGLGGLVWMRRRRV